MAEAEQPNGPALTRDQILQALRALSEALGRAQVCGEVCRFGGTVMVLAFASRASTKDVDAIFRPAETIREFARQIADGCGLPVDWLNDAVKGFVSDRHETTSADLPQFPNLRVTMPVPAGLPPKNADCTAPGLRRHWHRFAPFCYWRARRDFVRETCS